jgi:hypothetical protein
MRTTFLVGKVSQRGSEIVVVDGVEASPIPGPWTLKALVRCKPPSPSRQRGTNLGPH